MIMDAQHLIDVGLIYQFIHIYITVKGGADMKQVIGYLRQSTMKQQSLAAQKQAIEAIAENIIFNISTFIATNNQDAKIIVVGIDK